MSDRLYLTSKELAQRWRLSEQTLANWRHARKGPSFIRIGGRILYPISTTTDFERQWLSQHNSPVTSAATRS
jgi:hypothetical protein